MIGKNKWLFSLVLGLFFLSFSVNIASALSFGGTITSPFSKSRVHPVFGVVRPHNGMDIGQDYGVPIPAIANGTLETVGWVSGYGNTVIVRMDNGQQYLYGHCQDFVAGLRIGQRVTQGQPLAFVGSTGYSTGPHLHLELRINGSCEDPLFLAQRAGWTLDGSFIPSSGNYGSNGHSVEYNFDSYVNWSEQILIVSHVFLIKINHAISVVQPYLIFLCALLAMIDLIIFALQNHQTKEMANGLLIKMAKYSFLSFLIFSWDWVSEKLFKTPMLEVGDIILGEKKTELFFADPSILIQKVGFLLGNYISADELKNHTTDTSLMIFSQILVAIILLLTLFIVITLLARIFFFYLTCLMTLFATAFQANSATGKRFSSFYGTLFIISIDLVAQLILFLVAYGILQGNDPIAVGFKELFLFGVLILSMAFVSPMLSLKINKSFGGLFAR